MRGSLVATVLAAVGGAISIGDGPDWAAVVALVAFVFALVLRVGVVVKQPERAWYEARAGAESVKTLAWQFAVGGAPFPISSGDTDAAQRQLVARLTELFEFHADIRTAPDPDGQQVTAWMTDVRAMPPRGRRELYESERIADQINWYAAKSRQNAKRATQWSICVIGFQALGIVFAALRVVGAVDVDLLGIAAAAAAAAAAWLEVKDHSTLAEAYATTAHELGLVRAALPVSFDEDQWASYVSDAETAISREHTQWLARRRARLARPASAA